MTKFSSTRIEFFTIFDRVPKWFSWGLLVEWFDGRGYNATWLDRRTLGLDGAEDSKIQLEAEKGLIIEGKVNETSN